MENLPSKQQIAEFYNDLVEITKSILMKILERSPLGSFTSRGFNPKLSNDGSDCEKPGQQFTRL